MKRSSLLVCMTALLLASAGQGHQPATLDGVRVIEKPTISHALYGELSDEVPVLEIKMDFEQSFAMPFELLVPHKSEFQNFRPMMAVVAPGLPPPNATESDLLREAGIEIPDGTGVYVDQNDDEERLVIFESFTRRVFWSTGPIALAVGPGTTQIFVWSPEGETGAITVGFGVEEDFSDGFGKVFEDWSLYAY